jgi:hypothetical protein
MIAPQHKGIQVMRLPKWLRAIVAATAIVGGAHAFVALLAVLIGGPLPGAERELARLAWVAFAAFISAISLLVGIVVSFASARIRNVASEKHKSRLPVFLMFRLLILSFPAILFGFRSDWMIFDRGFWWLVAIPGLLPLATAMLILQAYRRAAR